ncbi:hypothetical protein [uncultured Gammaproteobacteria bacterium]|nr:hypothetical protein [uncultured Gammaproteobacteria bacterium]
MAITIISIGVMAIITAIGFLLASFHGLGESVVGSGVGHIQITQNIKYGKSINKETQISIDKITNQIQQIRFTTPRVIFEGLISSDKETVSIVGQGIVPNKEAKISSVFANIIEGNELSSELNSIEILLGSKLKESLKLKMNDYVTLLTILKDGGINAIDFNVEGVYETGIPEKDARYISIPITTAQELLGTDEVNKVVIVLRNTKDTKKVVAQLRKKMPKLTVKAWYEIAPYYSQVVALYTNIFSVVGIIILIVVLLSIANTMLMTVMERVREIGTLRAIGFSKKQLTAEFSLEGFLLGVIGVTFGLLLSVIIAALIGLLNIDMPPPPGRTTPYPLIIFIDYYAYCLVGIIMVFCTTFVAKLTINKVLKQSIIKSLNYD